MATKVRATKAIEQCADCGDPIEGHPQARRACRYNGWTNYETWCVKLWMDNDAGSYDGWREQAQAMWDEATAGEYAWQTREWQAVCALVERLKDEHEERAQAGTGEASVMADLLNAALGEVNWRDIAERLLEEIDRANGVGA